MPVQIENANFVAFGGAAVDAFQLWSKLTRGPVRSYTNTAPVGTPVPMPMQVQSQAFGPIDGYELFITSQPARLDLLLGPPPQDGPLSNIGDLSSALHRLREFAELAMQSLDSVTRLALITNGSDISSDAAEAIRKMHARVPQVPLLPGATDLFHQTIVPRALDSGIVINRMCRWYTGNKQIVEASASAGAAPTFSVRPLPVYAEYIDISTLEGAALARDALDGVLRGMISEAEEIHRDAYSHF